jgi:endonuclease/exonuclease/phosphatase family metal-dependent hydrolase
MAADEDKSVSSDKTDSKSPTNIKKKRFSLGFKLCLLIVILAVASCVRTNFEISDDPSKVSMPVLESAGEQANKTAGLAHVMRLISFNIAGDDKNWETRKSACYDVINNLKPDIIGFQELLPVNLKWALDNFGHLGWYGLTIEGSTKAYPAVVEAESCRIMYNANRFTVDSANSGAFWFSSTPDVSSEGWDDLRYCVYVRLVDINTADGIYVYNTHWAFGSDGQDSRTNAAKIMVGRIRSRAHTEDAFIVTGDFNATSSDTGIQILLQNMTTVVQNRIDWIFAESGKYELVSSEIISDINGTAASDHDVLAAVLTITE